MGNLASKPQGRRGIAAADRARNGESHIRNARLVELEAEITDRRMRIGTVLFE